MREAMIVCLCIGVSQKKICQLVKNGAVNLAEVQNACGVGTGCGSCLQQVEETIQKELKKKLKKPHLRDI